MRIICPECKAVFDDEEYYDGYCPECGCYIEDYSDDLDKNEYDDLNDEDEDEDEDDLDKNEYDDLEDGEDDLEDGEDGLESENKMY